MLTGEVLCIIEKWLLLYGDASYSSFKMHFSLRTSERLAYRATVHFTVVCFVTWPLSESETGVDLVLIQTSFFHMQIQTSSVAREQHELRLKSTRNKVNLQPHFHLKARSLSTQL